MSYFAGKRAVITGAGSGIGHALALNLNSAGCELWLSDINQPRLDETIAAMARSEVPAHTAILDVADKAAVHAYAQDIADRQGHVDVVINNAGVALGSSVADTVYEDFEWLMGINFWGVVYGSKAFLPLLSKSAAGHLINISSVLGIIAIPNNSAYNAAKFAVRGFTETLRQETASSNIHVCCVHPGGIKTNIARDSRGSELIISAEERAREFDKVARTTAESAAAQILRAAQKRKKRLLIGADAHYLSIISRLFPANYARLLPRLGKIGLGATENDEH
ncbi:MAG: NADP-dependent 3-hydroxy acid dehydrogenase YdfG [Alcanivorax sp.]|jgi:NADP-dependent 3-hydroxy acid dehydrogenase YdfG